MQMFYADVFTADSDLISTTVIAFFRMRKRNWESRYREVYRENRKETWF